MSLTSAVSVKRRATDPAPLPAGFRIALHDDTCEIRPGLWHGGRPARMLRLSPAGQAAIAELRRDPVRDHATGVVARRFVSAGLARPIPPPVGVPPAITVVVPVLDRAGELDRCLRALGRRYPVVVVDDGSADELSVRSVAARHGARIVRLAVNAGPAAARNAGLEHVDTALVAFVDSDTEPVGDWLALLAEHLGDPLVAAVAPRIVGIGSATTLARVNAGLDLGGRAADVRPYGGVGYVPSAALLARTDAIRGVGAFDSTMRVGEDVDLIWRLGAAGHVVRYAPDVQVGHHEPASSRALLRRRFGYGRSAAPLARRHPQHLAPIVLHPWFVATIAAMFAQRPRLATVAFVGTVVHTQHVFRRAGLPAGTAPRQAVHGLVQTASTTAGYTTKFAVPVVLAGLLSRSRRTRRACAALLVLPGLTDWATRRCGVGPIRHTAAVLADDVAYGAGVITGCVQHRTTLPLRPRMANQQ